MTEFFLTLIFKWFIFFYTTPWWIDTLIIIITAMCLGYFASPLFLYALIFIPLAFLMGASSKVLIALAVIFAFFIIKPLRRNLLSRFILKLLAKIIPTISETEKVTLDAGVVWSDAELFSGRPNFKKLLGTPFPELTEEEQNFLDGPVQEICGKVQAWQIYKNRSISPEVMQFLKENKFFGLMISKKYGGKEFSAYANSEIVAKLSTCSPTLGMTVMVPNSLGPGELLTEYGTEEQKQKYLPRLACGDELPCFALTEPFAGSDAGSITSYGVLFKGDDGKIYAKLNWNKRWITLAAIATLVGVAVRLKDPDDLLKTGEEDLGITCFMVPRDTPGVVLGRRHDPMSIPLYNCPTQGKDVVVNAEDYIIGGLEQVGQGWKMLMESLAAGRGISLPAQSSGGVKQTARIVSNHALMRKQFGIPIGYFEGVEEPLARIAGQAYICDALRKYTLSALDSGIKPPVATAITKYHTTEMMRSVIADGLDIMGGTGLSMGSRNHIAEMYMSAPIGITVEGANILTRTLMIFGQGAFRAHPYAYKEVKSIEENNLYDFDDVFWKHIGHIFMNLSRVKIFYFTRAFFTFPPLKGPARRYGQILMWASSTFALFSDIAMSSFGGRLKVKEKLTGRYADALSWMYIATAVLKRFESEGSLKEDLPFLKYSMKYCFSKVEEAFEGICANFDTPIMGWFFRYPIRIFLKINSLSSTPSDKLTHTLARLLLSDTPQRDRLTHGLFLGASEKDHIYNMEKAFRLIHRSLIVEKKVHKAIHKGILEKASHNLLTEAAIEASVITKEEAQIMFEAEKVRWNLTQVDDFTEEEYMSRSESLSWEIPSEPLNYN